MYSLEFQHGGHTHGQTDIRTCWAAFCPLPLWHLEEYSPMPEVSKQPLKGSIPDAKCLRNPVLNKNLINNTFEDFSLTDLNDGVKIPSREEIFGKVSELTAQYEEENDKFLRQMNENKVEWIPRNRMNIIMFTFFS